MSRVEGFPKTTKTKDGKEIVIRALADTDAKALHAFFSALPDDDRQFLRDDVTRPEFVERFLAKADFKAMTPMVAEHDGKIVGTATLYRDLFGWATHVAEIRVAVAHNFQRKGLGMKLVKTVVRIAVGMGLEKVVGRVVDNQVAAQRAFEKMGFVKEAVLKGHVKDVQGKKRDLLVMSSDLSHIWEAMEALVQDYSPMHE